MSTGPAVLSRRSLLRGAASVTVLTALAAISSCSDGSPPSAQGDAADAPATGSALLRLGHTIADGPDASSRPAGTTGTAPQAGAVTNDDAAVRAIAERDDGVRTDFAAGRTVRADGWLLSATESDVLVAYAGACPLPAC